MFGAIFLRGRGACMSELIELKLVTEGEAECLHRLQVEAFTPLYEKFPGEVRQKAFCCLFLFCQNSMEKVSEEKS